MAKKINKGWFIGGIVAVIGISGIVYLSKRNKVKTEEHATDLSNGTAVPTGSTVAIDALLTIALQLFDKYLQDRKELTQSEANSIATKIADLKIKQTSVSSSKKEKIQNTINKGIATLTKFGYKLDDNGKAVKIAVKSQTKPIGL